MANEKSRALGAETAKMRRILVTLAENAATLPDVSAERAVLERELTTVEDAKSRQDSFVGGKQRATQEMREAFGRAREAFLQLQSAAKFKLGPHNEKLASYQVKPLRKRGARQAVKLKKQEEALAEQEAKLQKKEAELAQQKQDADLLKREVELLKREAAQPAR
jgi:hypothetical protein